MAATTVTGERLKLQKRSLSSRRAKTARLGPSLNPVVASLDRQARCHPPKCRCSLPMIVAVPPAMSSPLIRAHNAIDHGARDVSSPLRGNRSNSEDG
jgi:hypothetical protein